jgi:hypothetical protein
MKGKQEPLSVRFWRFVEKTESCWLWRGGRISKTGYGTTSVMRKRILAHRASWELHNGPIPSGLWVLHTCDNPICVNPAHLFLGDRADNMRDAFQKGRIDMHKVSKAGTLAHYPHLTTGTE